MVQKLFSKVFGTSHQREMKKIQPTVDQINSFEAGIQALSDDQLKNKLKVGCFTGYSKISVLQDFFCTIFISNLQSIIVNDLQEELDITPTLWTDLETIRESVPEHDGAPSHASPGAG